MNDSPLSDEWTDLVFISQVTHASYQRKAQLGGAWLSEREETDEGGRAQVDVDVLILTELRELLRPSRLLHHRLYEPHHS